LMKAWTFQSPITKSTRIFFLCMRPVSCIKRTGRKGPHFCSCIRLLCPCGLKHEQHSSSQYLLHNSAFYLPHTCRMLLMCIGVAHPCLLLILNVRAYVPIFPSRFLLVVFHRKHEDRM
jgi:hypothetical protein